MSLRLHNTLTGKTEEYKPLKSGYAGVYNCGPTVYNYAHIGNLRAYVFTDILRRTLEWNGYTVHQVMNITDVGHLTSDEDTGDDKMRKALKRENKPETLEAMYEVGSFYMLAFIEDLKSLNISLPQATPRASEHIAEDIEIIQVLEKKEVAYKISDGIYFDISKFLDYGKLGGVNKANLEDGSRIEVNPQKRDPRDFNLWKLSDGTLGFDSPWGKGFPGWHIECSAMSRKYLGQPFDIHTGGVDHIGTHHNNEIAQSEAAFDTPLANYWLHNAHLNVSSGKMAKSGENFLTLRSLVEKGFAPLSYRYYLLGASYRKPMLFSMEGLKAAETTLIKLVELLSRIKQVGQPDKKYVDKFTEVQNDDLNTPQALAVLWELMKDASIDDGNKKATAVEFDKVLGLQMEKQIAELSKNIEIPENVTSLLKNRELARNSKDWKRADEIRDEIRKLGFEVKDTNEGQKIEKI